MAWTLGKVWGIPLRVHASAVFLLALVLLGGGGGSGGLKTSAVFGVVIVVSILVHEFGHALVARSLGLGPVSIVLHGFGGLTAFSKRPGHGQGILVGLAGPLAGMALGLLALMLDPGPTHGMLVSDAVGWLILVNIFWSLFNLLPMYPLDGGQVLWHVLAMALPAMEARTWVRRVSIAFAVAVGIASLAAGQFFLLVVCFFVMQQNRVQ
jgi:Zn-dependent protease